MAPTFKTVVVFLVTLQLVHHAALSNKFYDSKDLNGPLNNKLTFHSRFNVLSSLKSKQSVKQEPQVRRREELSHLNIERGSVQSSRSKRQLDQDADIDAEVFSNDPKMFSYGKSMPMTTADDVTDEHQHEKPESGLWAEDVDTTNKNSLGGLEDQPKKEDESTHGEQDEENSQSEKQSSTFHSQFQDISSANHDPTPKMTDEDNLSASSSQTSQSNSTEIHIVPTLLYEGHESKERETVESKSTSLTTDSELQDSASIDDDDNDTGTEDKELVKAEQSTPKSPGVELAESHLVPDENNDQKDASPNVEEDSKNKANTDGEPEKNEMEKDEIVETNEKIHSNEATALNEDMVPNEEGLGHHNKESEEIISKELDIDENEGDLSEHLDQDDVDVFMHLPVDESVSKSSSGQLKLLDSDIIGDTEEGSGDMESDPTGSRETNNIHDKAVANGTDSNPSAEISPTMDNINFNIDTDTDADTAKEEQEENEHIDEDEKEIESPIADPTDITLKVDDPSETAVLSESDEEEEKDGELPIPEPTGISSKNDDASLTYDRKSIINPFNMDNASEISRNIGKAIGILDSSEETTDGEELEGSGEPILFHRTEDKNSLENGAMFKIDPRMLDEDTQTQDYSDTTTNRDDTLSEKEVTEEPIVVRHHDGLLNAAILPENENVVPHVTHNSSNADEIEETATRLGVIAVEEIAHVTVEDTHESIPTTTAQIHPDQVHPSTHSENGSVLPMPSGINEMGIKNNEKVVSPENGDETSSSSTGSFIVLGAIMATIVALLGYSVIKSYRQKQENSRRPPEDDIGTELKEIDTLLPVAGKNGHGPPNRLHVESDRLLGSSGENDKNDMKPDGSYPIYQNGVHGEDGITDKPNNALQIDDPNDLSEVKVNSHNQNNLIPQVANGLNSSPGNSDHNNKTSKPKSPSADDRGSRAYETKPETAKIKMFIDHDSIPKTPIVIVKRGPANVEM